MTFISSKIIHGKTRHYLEKSIRFHNGKVKKISVYLKDYNQKKKHGLDKYKQILEDKTTEELLRYAKEHYKNTIVFHKNLIKELEQIKINYNKIKKKPTKSQLNDILDRFTINFTYESNAIEGNSLTLKDVTSIIKEGKIAKGKDLREIYETINTRKAMELIFNNKLKINEKDIIKLHKILVKDTGIKIGYKTLPNFLLGRNVNTTPPEKVQYEMQELIKWYKKNEDLHPLQLAAEFHGKFERIHPFEDGNGRVGRLLINIIMINKRFPPFIIRKSQRISYLNALEAFDNKHKDKLYRFVIDRFKDTYNKFFKIYVKYL